MLKINFSANKAHTSLCIRPAAQLEGLGFGEGYFSPRVVTCAVSLWGEGASAAPAMGWPQRCTKP